MGELTRRLMKDLNKANPRNIKQVEQVLMSSEPVLAKEILLDVYNELLYDIEELEDKTSFNIYLMIKRKRDSLLETEENE